MGKEVCRLTFLTRWVREQMVTDLHQMNPSSMVQHQQRCFWTRSSARPTPRSGELTPFLEALLTQQQEQAERDKESIQSISSILGHAVQCFERSAQAAERQPRGCEALVNSGQQDNNILHGHFHTPYTIHLPHTISLSPTTNNHQHLTTNSGPPLTAPPVYPSQPTLSNPLQPTFNYPC